MPVDTPIDLAENVRDDIDRVSVHSDDSKSSSSSDGSCCSVFSRGPFDESSNFSLTPPITPPTSPDAKQSFSPIPQSPPSSVYSRSPSPDIFEGYTCPHFVPVSPRPHLLKSVLNVPSVAPRSDDFMTFLARRDAVWVDKLHHIYSLCPKVPLVDKLVMIRRPAGYGHTTFITTGMFAHDCRHAALFRHLFPALPSCFPDGGDRATLILTLDMGYAFDHDIAGDIEERLDAYLNNTYEWFLRHYHECLDISLEDIMGCIRRKSLTSFANIMNLLHQTGLKVVLFVEDLNWPLIHSTPDNIDDIVFYIDRYVVRPIQQALGQGLIVGGVLLGHPVVEEPAWVHSHYQGDVLFAPIACDRSDDEHSRGAFGFTLPEVVALAEELLENSDVRLAFINEVRGRAAAYRHKEYIEYSMNDVMFRLRQRTGQPERCSSPYWDDDDDEELSSCSEGDEDDSMDVDEIADMLTTENGDDYV